MAIIEMNTEVLKLIHTLEVNKDGWLQKAQSSYVRICMYSNKGPCTKDDILQQTNRLYPGFIDENILDLVLSELIKINQVVMSNGKYILTSTTVDEMERNYKIREEIFNNAKGTFQKSLMDQDVKESIEHEWVFFSDSLNKWLIKNGVLLINPFNESKKDNIEDFISLFYSKYPKSVQIKLQFAINNFFESKNGSEYLRIMINGFLHYAAGQLDKQTLEYLNKVSSNKYEIRFFLDTNILYSLLNLHKSNYNDLTKVFYNQYKKLLKTTNIKIYVLKETITEAKETIKKRLVKFENISKEVAQLLIDKSSGIEYNYLYWRINNPSEVNCKPQIYIMHFVNNIENRLQDMGIKIYDDKEGKIKGIHNVHAVSDDFSEYKINKSFDNHRIYSTYHDAILLLLVKTLRPNRVNNPFENKYWILSEDRNLKNYSEESAYIMTKLVLLPNEGISLINFWVPKNDEVIKSFRDIIESFTYFEQFDQKTEQTMYRIIGTIEDLTKLGESTTDETIVKILLDKHFIEQASITKDDSELKSLIDNELKKMLEKTTFERDELKKIVEKVSTQKKEILIKGNVQVEETRMEIKEKEYAILINWNILFVKIWRMIKIALITLSFIAIGATLILVLGFEKLLDYVFLFCIALFAAVAADVIRSKKRVK